MIIETTIMPCKTLYNLKTYIIIFNVKDILHEAIL